MVKLGPIKKLGTIWWFEFFDCEETNVEKLTHELMGLMDQFESNYSRFLETSLLSMLNNTGILHNPSGEFIDLLTIARTAYKETNGVFNIAIGGYLEASGYNQNYSFTREESVPIIPPLDEVLTVTEEVVTLKYGARIDFGGFGKGYLIDLLATHLKKTWSQEFLINGGGDMYGTLENGGAITIGLAHPKTQEQIGSLALSNMGFAASSPYLRTWKDQYNTSHHHLIGNEDAQAVFVTAQSALTADIWATTLSIDATQTPPPSVSFTVWKEDTTDKYTENSPTHL